MQFFNCECWSHYHGFTFICNDLIDIHEYENDLLMIRTMYVALYLHIYVCMFQVETFESLVTQKKYKRCNGKYIISYNYGNIVSSLKARL